MAVTVFESRSKIASFLLDFGVNMEFDRDLDVQGLNCPLPILRTKKALAEMATGQIVRVCATDPHSVQDFAAFAKQTGNALLAQNERDGVFEFFLRRK